MPRGWREELIAIGVLSLCATLPVFMAAVAAQALRARSLQTLAMCVVMSAVAVGAVRFLARMRVPVAIAQALAVMLVVLWLASPIWAAKLLAGSSGETLMRLSDYHPLIALNGAYQPELGDWSHQPVAYQWLMNLGQDVPYLPPASVWKSAAAHLAVAIFLWLLALVRSRKRPPQLIG
jgi:hypothetical protein